MSTTWRAYLPWRDEEIPPTVLRRVYGWLTVASLVLWIVATFTGLVNSVAYVSHLSQAALSVSFWTIWQAARAEVRAQHVEEETMS